MFDRILGRHREDGPDFTERSTIARDLARAEAVALDHGGIGTEHLLLGLLREERGIRAQRPHHVGGTLDALRPEVLRLRSGSAPDAGTEPLPR